MNRCSALIATEVNSERDYVFRATLLSSPKIIPQHREWLLSFFLSPLPRTTVYSGLFKCLPWFRRYWMCMCVCARLCIYVCELPSFIFNFALFIQQILCNLLTKRQPWQLGQMWQNCTEADREKMKLMAVTSEQLLIRGQIYRGSVAERCAANKNASSDPTAEPRLYLG